LRFTGKNILITKLYKATKNITYTDDDCFCIYVAKIILAMLLEGLTLAMIVKLTALPEAEIVKLRQKLKNTGH
jgi:hypothetical protein